MEITLARVKSNKNSEKKIWKFKFKTTKTDVKNNKNIEKIMEIEIKLKKKKNINRTFNYLFNSKRAADSLHFRLFCGGFLVGRKRARSRYRNPLSGPVLFLGYTLYLLFLQSIRLIPCFAFICTENSSEISGKFI